ncbi:MAG: hypothetical protein ACPL1D_00450 [Microgenomates group bacterium]
MNRKELLIISIIIFLSVIMWLVADIYHSVTVSKIKQPEMFPLVINYKVNKNILDLLEKKQP